MGNLRIVQSKFISSTELVVEFSDSLNPFLNTSNVRIDNVNNNFTSPQVLKVLVEDTVLRIKSQPFQPYALYDVSFQSSSFTKFNSKNGSNFLIEDANNNVLRVIGPELPENEVRDSLVSYLSDNIYDLNEQLNRDIINSQSDVISRASFDIKQLKNDNYLSLVVENEIKTRGKGPSDRLNEEGAYELLKVSTRLNNSLISDALNFSSFPSFPITLQATTILAEKLIAGSAFGSFDGLILNLKNSPVTKVTRIQFVYNDGSYFNYDPNLFGYKLKNNRYDPLISSSFLLLTDYQVELSDEILNVSGFKIPQGADIIYIDYQYKALGKIISTDSVQVSKTTQVIREATPPIVTSFSLSGFPVVNANDVEINIGGVVFLDPQSNPPFSNIHPAFSKELIFNVDALPSFPGQYTIDYSSGTVYVYGASTNDGTGNFPPTASYFYRNIFSNNLDYTFDQDTFEIVRSPVRELEGQTAKISFQYEMTLVPGVDFIPQIHTEVLNERVENKISSSNVLNSTFGPITNVFRVFNETTGEIYRIDGWRNKTILFTAKNPPSITSIVGEKINLTDVSNEILVVNQETFNHSNVRIFTIFLLNNRIGSRSEDSIGSSFNSSVSFSQKNIFQKEIYFDDQTENITENIDRLNPGQYEIDYQNGVIYVAVSLMQNEDIGTVNYKKTTVTTNFNHIFGINNIYYSLDSLDSFKISYTNFTDNEVFLKTIDVSAERFLNNDLTNPLIVFNNTIKVTNDIKEVRGIFDHYDLTNNSDPLNFALNSSFEANIITLAPIEISQSSVVSSTNKISLPLISSGIFIESVISIIRISDNAELFDSGGSITGYTINLSGINSPQIGDQVIVILRYSLNSSATPIVDYSRGDFLIDYQKINDEILVSYEYGDNCLDFSQSNKVAEGQTYYVTYKIGALRDALLKNFGSLVNIPVLNNFDTSLERERYREALQAALQSFTKGPTIVSLKQLVSTITHIEPQIIESLFEHWVLGFSHLSLDDIKTTGDLKLLKGKFDSGVLIENPGESISLPVASNLSLEEGSLETWIIPEWNGLDNDAILNCYITKDGNTLSPQDIFIGSDSHNPILNLDSTFSFDKNSSKGFPAALYTNIGVFIFYDVVSNNWKIYAKDKPTENHVYKGKIISSGEVYNVKFIPGLNEINDSLKSGVSSIDFELFIDTLDALSPDGYDDGYNGGIFNPGDGYSPNYSFDGFSFMADNHHYIFDFGEDRKNRFSLFKDGSGYLNFSIHDSVGNIRSLSKDISTWKAGEKHHLGISWKLNTADLRDEMHLFVDGFEVPNILKYGGRPIATTTDRFRTVSPEIILGPITKNIIRGNDAFLVAGSNTINFANTIISGININDTIVFSELGLGSFNITGIGSNFIVISSPAPISVSNAKFSINPFSTIVSTQISLYKNISVSIIHNNIETEIPGLRSELPYYSISTNALNQDILTILGDASIGDKISIRTLGLNYKRIRDRQFIYGNNTSIIKTQLPMPINLNEVNIYAVPLPLLPISLQNATLGGGIYTATNLKTTQTTNNIQGRTLNIRISGSNTDFTTPVTVTIHGNVTEVLMFTQPGNKNTINKFINLSGVDVTVKPFNTTKPACAIEIKEAFSLNYSEGNNSYPVIRYSYQASSGTNLTGSGIQATDLNNTFIDSDINQYLVISSPGSVAGTYSINNRIDNNNVTISSSFSVPFTNGIYKIYHVALGNSGFNNGFFTFETAGQIHIPYILPQGYFEFDYSSYLSIPINIGNQKFFIGSDIHSKNQAKSILDEFRILSKMISDVRIGEAGPADEQSFTNDFVRITPFEKNKNTLTLIHFDELPPINDIDYWISSNRDFIQTSSSVNSNFENALVVTNSPFIVDNTGILNTLSEGTIEFWVSPKYNTLNDPNYRYYFDANVASIESVKSITSNSFKLTRRALKLLSIRLASDTKNTGIDYLQFASLKDDNQTVILNKALPAQNISLVVSYVPTGTSGNRISIYKDVDSFINFEVKVGDNIFKVGQFISWARESWHRVKVTYKFNRADNRDELRLFVDGEEGGVIKFGQGFLFGQGFIFGQRSSFISPLTTNIDFKDQINQFMIGTDYLGHHSAMARFDNIRFSNKARQPINVAGQPKDIDYNNNTDTVLPVIEDIYTTKIFDFNTLLEINTDFAILRDEIFGLFNFNLNVIDSFDIVSSNNKIKQILETLVDILKPATSKAVINYLK